MTAALNAQVVGQNSPTPEQLDFFESKVRPLLAEHCYQCHSHQAERVEGNLWLDSREGVLTGGDSGPSIALPDEDGASNLQASSSLLLEAVRYESYEMPPKGKLADSQIAVLEKWVQLGAPWPDEAPPTHDGSREVFDLEMRKTKHWAWQPIHSPAIPVVENQDWARDTIDRFVLHRLEQDGLQPAADADRTALMRRAYFDLIGLPPTSEQVDAFLSDTGPDAFARLVDELLASPHFGERWARHWLDLVRYAESHGHEFDPDEPNAHQYRDYVIRAFNADVPYAKFVTEHIAGDLVRPPRLHPIEGYNESILGTGFWFFGDWTHSPVDTRKDESDRFDNMIDVMSKTFLGVTIACARCHDHKFDAISSEDYYALSGFLQSSDYQQVRFETMEHNRHVAEQLASVDESYREQLARLLEQHNLAAKLRAPALGDRAAKHVLVNYADLASEDFLQNGFVFGNGPQLFGEPLIEAAAGSEDNGPAIRYASRGAAVVDPAWASLKSVTEGTVAPRSLLKNVAWGGRALRTPTFLLTDKIVHCRVRGTGHVIVCPDSLRMVSSPLHGNLVQPIEGDAKWKKIDLSRFVGHRLHLEFAPADGAELEVSFVVEGATDDVLREIERWEASCQQLAEQHSRKIEQTVSTNDHARETYERIVHEWHAARQALREQIKNTSRLAIAMLDGTAENDRLLIRGSSAKPGPEVPRRFLTALSGEQPMAIGKGSGRLELARQIVDPSNPLTNRVIVNRIWKHLMGRGIVPTTDDFGVLGQRPTHPELLDHLAIRFASDGQSIKSMIRRIMLTRSYGMTSKPNAAAMEADPNNTLWHHRPPKRLEGEAIRDALLRVSGQLDGRMFGVPTPVHLTEFMTGRGRPPKSGPLDGDNRRSIYMSVRRNFISPFMLAFDTPTPFSSMGNRNVSNVPAQALILMNDPFVLSTSKAWAQRTLQDTAVGSTPERIRHMFLTAYARQPTDEELHTSKQFISRQMDALKLEVDDPQLWTHYAHALVNTKEFIFIR